MVRKILRFFGGLVLLIVLAWAGTGLYFRLHDAGPWPERAEVVASGVFEREIDCFHGGGYDEWMADLRGLNGHWNPLGWVLAARLPRAMYEDAIASVNCRYVTYEHDGYPIGAYVIMPKGAEGERLPVLVYNRGGNGSFGANTFFMALYALVPYAQEGFLVVASQYRGSRDSEPETYGIDEFGGADVGDVRALVALADRLPQADTENRFLLGASRGAMMNYLVARGDARFRAIASINGAADLEQELAFRPEMERVYVGRIPDYATRKSEALAERSVLRWAEELPRDMPILLIHGGRDERVDPRNGPRLKERLDAIGHPNKLVMYPEDDHSLNQNWRRAQDEVVAWFREHRSGAGPAAVVAGGSGR